MVRAQPTLRLALGAAVAATMATSLAAGPFADRDQRVSVHVVAARQSGLFTLCLAPVTSASKAQGDNAIVTFNDGLTHIAWPGGLSVELPPPPPPRSGAPPFIARAELDRRVVVPDPVVQDAIEQALRAQPRNSVVADADSANIVIIAEAFYIPMTFWTAMTGPDGILPNDPNLAVTEMAKYAVEGHGGRMTFPRVAPGYSLTAQSMRSGDWKADFLQAILAVAVPAETYTRHPGDAEAMLAAQVWSGAAFNQSQDSLEDAVRAVRRKLPFSLAPRPASPAQLAASYVAGRSDLGAQFKVCAASDGPLGASLPGDTRRPDALGPTLPPAVSTGADEPQRAVAPAKFGASVIYVTVPTVVSDMNGAAVAGLAPGVFKLYEDGVEQRIDKVIEGRAPVDVALLVDTSASMRVNTASIADALLSLVGRLGGEDRLLPVSFSDQIFVESPFTGDRPALRRAILQMQPGQGTRLYDAVDLVASERLGAAGERAALVLLTDGLDTRSRVADAQASIAALDAVKLPVYVIHYGTPRAYRPGIPRAPLARQMHRGDDYLRKAPATGPLPKPLLLPEGAGDDSRDAAQAIEYLQGVADRSGGRLYRAETADRVAAALSAIAAELRSQYTLCYYPANQARDGTLRNVRVDVLAPSAQVRARKIYAAPLAKR